ncbi:extracellular solute-binding protein [Kineosporia rhizophila]|uniref:ABC transporter substrate-binding protein n=1 Tax=Kineosporia TaxID=49184 RepID=UPI001E4A5DDE|nr:extracellular solute-binding protein [Kineosporia sp. NBRC 101677]MCE0535499.1 extracellular solute-binding protein [Kineosporia rhizophila]GLY16712.1 sugar ABC transporter substrate-binding protein [Kineosporia sp. NBRC 101677]
MQTSTARWAAATATALLLLTGCGGESPGSGSPSTAKDVPQSWSGGTTTVQLWHDNAAVEPAVNQFNQKFADQGIQIEFVEKTDLNTNIRNAFQAGSGPDLFVTQTADLASFVSEGIAADLSGYYDSIAGDYSDTANAAVTTGDRQWAVPLSSIPTFMLYNSEVFERNGLDYPTTFEEFLDAGTKLKKQGVSIYNLAGEDPTTLIYMAWQAGAQWYSLKDGTWHVNVDGPQTRKAAEILQSGLEEGIFSKISYAEYAAMMQSYDKGDIASRQLSTWQVKGMQSNLKQSLGAWEPAPNLKWQGGPDSNASFTRALAVNAKTKNTDAAVFAAHWLSTGPESLKALADPDTGLAYYPAVKDGTAYTSLTEPTKLLGEHAGRWSTVVDTAAEQQLGDWTYGPNWAGAFSQLQDLWGKAVAGQIKATEIAPSLQAWIVEDLKQQGVSVAEG